jgi:hypothetical protein
VRAEREVNKVEEREGKTINGNTTVKKWKLAFGERWAEQGVSSAELRASTKRELDPPLR